MWSERCACAARRGAADIEGLASVAPVAFAGGDDLHCAAVGHLDMGTAHRQAADRGVVLLARHRTP